MSPLLQIRLLGGFDLSSKGGVAPALRGTKPRSLFAFLALHRALPHTRDELAGLFWPDASDAVARRRLSQALWRIRRGFQTAGLSPPLISQADLVRFDESANYWLDVTAFEQAVREGLDGMAGMAEVERASSLERAAALYQGELMAGFYEDWIILERERLREMHLNALERLVALYEHLGAYEEALHYARRLAAEEPLRERAHYEVMQLCRRLNRPQEALKQYERLVAILAEDLGASPSLPVQRLYRQLASATKWEIAPRPQRASARMTAPLLVDAAALPLVGRKAERAQLLTLVDDALRGAGGMALVEGEAGVGKTRLLQEIARDAAWREMRTLWGRGRDLAARPSYDALLEAVRAGLSPLRASQLAQLLSRGELETLTLLLPELRDWLPQLKGPTAPVGSERLSQALSRLVLALGEIAPHLILLEDLHWADAGVLETLVQLAETLGRRRREGRPSRLLLIASYRGEDAREREEVWSSLRRLAQAAGIHPLRLSRLAARETGELVRQALGLMEPAPRFEARIYDESEGNPLFVLETLRALMDEEMLFCDAAGQWRTPFDETTRDYGELPVPPGVVQVIERRLRRLPPDLRIVLDAAAVLGREFDYPLLAHVLTRSPRVILDALTELMQRGFLLEESSGYAFAHDKIRQVTYEAMDAPARRQWHGRAAQALAGHEPAQVEALAYHAFHGGMWAQALVANRQAGDRARAVYAWRDAVAFYSQALKALSALTEAEEKDRLALLQGRGEAYQNMGRWLEAERDFETVCRMARDAGDDDAYAAAANRLSYLHFQRGDYERSISAAQQAYEAAHRANSKRRMAHALLNLANALRNGGRPREALGHYRRAAVLLEALNEKRLLADCLNRMGFALLFADQWDEAEKVMLRSLSLRRELDDKIGLAYSLCNLGSLYLLWGDFEKAEAMSAAAYDAAVAAQDPYGQDAALLNWGGAYLGLGDLKRAVAYLRRAVDIGREIGDEPLIMEGLADLGRAHVQMGDMVNARSYLDEALRYADGETEIWYRPKVYVSAAEFYLALGDADAALDYARQALTLARQLDAVCVTAPAHEIMARALAAGASEDDEAIRRHFEKSIERARRVGAQAMLAQSLAAYGGYLQSERVGEGARARALLVEAKNLFEQLGMVRELAELQAEGERNGRIVVSLPALEAPTGRPLRRDEWRSVLWTVVADEDESVRGKGPRRRNRLLRLLREAEEQGAAPRVQDLARALGVCERTIKRDLAALRAAGQPIRTRGQRRAAT